MLARVRFFLRKMFVCVFGETRAYQSKFFRQDGVSFRVLWPVLKHGRFLLSSKAQNFQDVAALNYIGNDIGRRSGGYFIEIGVGDGVHLSNTYMFEKKLGWRGLLCEPHPDFISSVRQTRIADLDVRAVYGESGLMLDFSCVEDEPLLSTLTAHKDGDARDRSKASGIVVETVSVVDLFRDHDVPAYVDFLSIDTEGSEVEILKAIPFADYRFGFVCVEHNDEQERKDEMDRIMGAAGYVVVLSEISGFDSWYVLT